MKRTGKNIKNIKSQTIPAMVSPCPNCGFNSTAPVSDEQMMIVRITIIFTLLVTILSLAGVMLAAL